MPMIAQTNCPESQRLQALLDGLHEDPELTAHLDRCTQCQRELEHLAQYTPLALPRSVPEPITEETALHRIMAELKDNPADACGDDDFSLDFLTPSERPGSLGRFGTYEVEQVIGRGGMGLVLRALDADLNRIVAIKVIAPQFAASASMRRRFVREARAAAAVCHDHVVTIHQVDPSGPLPYLVMQYVPGPSLQERLDQSGPLDVKEILRIGSQAASGLAAAHAQGLIHRDVKPANILLEDDMERVKLTDFGLARAMDDVRITQSAVLAGTPQYMAPEQARGEALDYRADLFSLGSVLYAMCTGRPPFRAGAPLAVMKRVCEETPRSIREQNPNIPEWLERVVMMLLAKDPAQRFQTAGEVADLLGRCLAHVQQPKHVPRPPIPRRKRETPRAPRFGWRQGLAVLFLLLLCGLAATIITIKTNQGTLVIEVDDPDIKVTVEKDDVVISGTGLAELRLRPGDYKVKATKDGKIVEDQPITIKRGEKTIVTIRREAAQAARVPIRADQVFTTEFIDTGTVKQGVAVSQAAISPDGKLIATGAADGSVHLLDLATGKVLRTFKGHTSRIRLVKFFPDRNILVTVSDGGEIRLWDTATGKELSSHNLPIKLSRAAVSPDGKVVAGSLDTDVVRLWDVASGKEKVALMGDPTVQALAFSPDGKVLATGTPPGTVRLWDAATGKAFVRLEPARTDRNDPGGLRAGNLFAAWGVGTDQSIAFSPDGRRLACATGEKIISVWDIESGKEVQSLLNPGGTVGIVTFSPDGRQLVTVSEDNTLRAWSPTQGKLMFAIKGGEVSFTSVVFSPDGKRFVVVSGDGTVRLFDAVTGKQISSPQSSKTEKDARSLRQELNETIKQLQAEREMSEANRAQADAMRQLAVSREEAARRALYVQQIMLAQKAWEAHDAERAAKALNDCLSNQRGWEWHYLKRVAAGEKPELVDTTESPANGIAFSPDGRMLAQARSDGTARLVFSSSPGKEHRLFKHAGNVQEIAFSPDGKLIATASTDHSAQLWDAQTGQLIGMPFKLEGAVHGVAFSPDGKQLATAGANGFVKVWDVATHKLVFQCGGLAGSVFSVAFSPDGKRLASASTNQQETQASLSLWDGATGKELIRLTGHESPIVAVRFSPDGKRLASASLDQTARVWDTATGKEVMVLQGHTGRVRAVAYSPDGLRLATASDDKTVKLWDAATGQQVLTLKGHTDKVTGVAFSPDGKQLATCGADKRIIIYDATPKPGDRSETPARRAEKKYTFEIRNKPWSQVLEWFADQTGLALVGSAPTGTFNFIGQPNKTYTLPQIIDIINEGLLNQSQKFLLIRGERSFRLVPADEELDVSLIPCIHLDDLDKYGNSELVSVTIPLKSLVAEDAAADLKKLLDRFGNVATIKTNNSLILRDTAGVLRRISKILLDAEKAERDKKG
jgi:WD40 repeat protein/serine/threonine protein kinase